ncbi:MAG: ATP-grasp domain-containing protein [Pseudomonadota bacterium]|nr:ATP-grasp domain-containing protein [Pseudomonadota bacterium]
MLNEFILLEYFTTQSNVNFKEKKSIFKEAIKLSNKLALNFSKNNKISKVHLLRNRSLQTPNNRKIIKYGICEKEPLEKILDKFRFGTYVLLISPETEFKNLRLYKSLEKKFILLNSSLKNIEIFSSKLKTNKALKKKNINTIEIEKELKSNTQYVSKPEFGAGSTDIIIFTKNDKIKKTKKTIIQKYYDGKKGSFSMICDGESFQIISCNEQLLKFEDNQVYQIGLIMGGLESYRDQINELGKKICKYFPNLFGYIGVDIVQSKDDWKVIEINPRFTSSYIGLERAYGKEIINKITEFYIHKKFNKKICTLQKKVKVFF